MEQETENEEEKRLDNEDEEKGKNCDGMLDVEHSVRCPDI